MANQLNELLYDFASNGKYPLLNQLNDFILEVENAENVSALTAYLFADILEKKMKELKDKAKNAAVTQAEMYGKNTKLLGLEIQVKEAGTKYDFTGCNHPRYSAVTNSIEVFKAELKEIETTLKTITKPMNIIDDESGEILSLNPPIKTSTPTIMVKL